MKFLLLICLSLSCFVSNSQDSTFIYTYKNLRSLVDSGKTFSLLMFPFQSSRYVSISFLADDFKNAFHFLTNKKQVSRNGDFRIAVMVDNVVLNRMNEVKTTTNGIKEYYERRPRDSSQTGWSRDLTDDIYIKQFHYTLDYYLLVETAEKLIYVLPLKLEEKLILSAQLGSGESSTAILQRQLEDILLRYKNHYVDRVDW